MIIVDDTSALISSANVNDRSLTGESDSESGVYLKFASSNFKKNEIKNLRIKFFDSIFDKFEDLRSLEP